MLQDPNYLVCRKCIPKSFSISASWCLQQCADVKRLNNSKCSRKDFWPHEVELRTGWEARPHEAHLLKKNEKITRNSAQRVYSKTQRQERRRRIPIWLRVLRLLQQRRGEKIWRKWWWRIQVEWRHDRLELVAFAANQSSLIPDSLHIRLTWESNGRFQSPSVAGSEWIQWRLESISNFRPELNQWRKWR